MKTPLLIILAAALMLLVSSNAWAEKKAKLGPCVKACVHAFNPSLADSGADEFMADDFRAKECVQMCKQSLYEGECNSWADDCCNVDYLDTDPDCQSEPPTDPPDPPGDGLPPDRKPAEAACCPRVDPHNRAGADALHSALPHQSFVVHPNSDPECSHLPTFSRRPFILLRKEFLGC